jgi:hypothetical protein
VSEQERGRMSAERANAHLAKAESELEAAQRFVDPGGGGESELALARAIASARACVADARVPALVGGVDVEIPARNLGPWGATRPFLGPTRP